MLRLFFIFLFLTTSMGSFSQGIADSIYQDLDSFIGGTPDESSVKTLAKKVIHYKDGVKTKDEKVALVILQCNLAYYQKTLGQYTEAVNSYESASSIYLQNELKGYDIIEYCLKPLGNLYTRQGDFTSAENIIKQYIFMAKEQAKEDHKIAGIINLSVVYHNTGNYNLATKILKEAIKTPGLSAEKKDLLENNLTANLIALNQIEEAQKLNSLQKHESANSVEDYKNAAQMAFKAKQYDQALHYLEKAQVVLVKQPDFTARQLSKIYVAKGDVHLASAQLKKADSSIRLALSLLLPTFNEKNDLWKEALYPENTLLDIFDGLAYLAKDTEAALKYFDLSFQVSHLIRQQINSQEATIINQQENRRRSEKCIALLYREYETTGKEDLLERAFGYAEHSKATVLKEALNRKALLKQFPHDSILLEEKALVSKQENAIDLLVRKQLTNSSAEAIQNVIAELNEINVSLKNVRRSIREEHGKDETAGFTIEKVHRKLKSDQAVLSFYFYGQHDIYHFFLTDGLLQLRPIRLDTDLKNSIRDFISFFDGPSNINSNIDRYKTTAVKLYQKLQLDQSKAAKNLLIVPDGLLGFIPFEALLTSKTTTNVYEEMPFLLKQSKVFYSTSADLYLRAVNGQKSDKILGLFPVFDEEGARMLTYSIEEAASLEKDLNAKVFLRKTATKSNFINNATDYDILHLSTHASGGNFVVPANITFADEVMLVHEIYGLAIDPYLVVLSACETGVGKLQRGEGAMSIARAFQYAGAQNLLFSLWQVNDYATASLMQEFYESYDKIHSAFLANREAKLSYLANDNISNPKKSPYYWSAFVYYGMPEAAASENSYFYIFVGLILLVVLIALGVRKYRT